MSIKRKIKDRVQRRQQRVRAKFSGSVERPRLSVFRSLNHISGQIIDDTVGNTLASASSLGQVAVTGTKTEIAKAIGLELATRALAKGISKISFDRGSCLYHGRVKAFAEGLRAGGLEF